MELPEGHNPQHTFRTKQQSKPHLGEKVQNGSNGKIAKQTDHQHNTKGFGAVHVEFDRRHFHTGLIFALDLCK